MIGLVGCLTSIFQALESLLQLQGTLLHPFLQMKLVLIQFGLGLFESADVDGQTGYTIGFPIPVAQ